MCRQLPITTDHHWQYMYIYILEQTNQFVKLLFLVQGENIEKHSHQAGLIAFLRIRFDLDLQILYFISEFDGFKFVN